MNNHGINLDYVNPFIEAITHALQTSCSLSPTRDRVFLKGDGEEVYGVSGIINLSGEATGAVVLNFPDVVARRLVGKLKGEDFPSLTSSVVDGVSELTSLIAGDAKNRLEQKGFKFEIGTPKIVTGRNFITVQSKAGSCLVVSFTSEVGRFCMEVSIKKVA